METEVIRWRQSSGRRKTFIVLAALFGVLSGTLLFGWISLIFGWFAGGVDQIHRVHNIGGGALFGILVAFGFLFQAWNPERKIALMHQLGGAILGIIVAAVIAQDWAILGFAALVAIPTGALWILHPARTSSISGGDRSLTLLTLTLIAVIPAVTFAVTMAANQRNGLPSDPHVKFHHWSGMAAMALAIVLVAFVASLHTSGWLIAARCVALSAAVYGLASGAFASYPGLGVPYPGSEGVGWGLAVIAWAVAFAAVAEWQARGSVRSLGPSPETAT